MIAVSATAIASESPQACERHKGQCAYTGTEPDRCPVCHRSWSVITGRDEDLAALHAKPPREPRSEDVVRVEHEGRCGR
jgi:hypothetical protein